MNVTKCTNGHFFDADKYDLCPHCGAVAIVKTATAPVEEKKQHTSLFGRKKAEDNVDMAAMPDKTMGKTFGFIPNEDNNSGGAGNDVVVQADDDIYNTCNVCGNTYDKTYATCPHCAQKAAQEKAAQEKAALEVEKEEVEEIVPEQNNTSLRDAVKKVASTNEGKTVGFFSMGNTNSPAATEPVVGWIVCIKGEHFGEAFNIAAGRNSIGRGEDNKIILPRDGSVSRNKHAWLTYEPKKREFFIQPGDGSGLSYLNGDNIMESKKLTAKDILEFGNGQYMFVPLCDESFTWEDYMIKE